jgi:redox-sensing transcriptional repressor
MFKTLIINTKEIPHKTIERLSKYRRALLLCVRNGKTHIYSHELASILHLTPVQVRRDLMLIGFAGSLKQGYTVLQLIEVISNILDNPQGINVCVVGLGNLGRSLIKYFQGKRTRLEIVAAFDNSINKIGLTYKGVYCFSNYNMEKIIKEKGIKIAIVTVPPEKAKEVVDKLVRYGIKGILNYTSTPVQVPNDVFLDEYDMITTLEKAAFFVKNSSYNK